MCRHIFQSIFLVVASFAAPGSFDIRWKSFSATNFLLTTTTRNIFWLTSLHSVKWMSFAFYAPVMMMMSDVIGGRCNSLWTYNWPSTKFARMKLRNAKFTSLLAACSLVHQVSLNFKLNFIFACAKSCRHFSNQSITHSLIQTFFVKEFF